jgi:hypothetical protein
MIDSKLKLDNSKSRFGKKNEENKANKEQFEADVSEHQQAQTAIMKKVADLAKQYVGFVKDTTLVENKGPILLQLEGSVPKELSEISLLIDNDETTEQISLGSNSLILLLLKTTLIQRDIINQLSYKVSKLEKQSSSEVKENG